MNWIFDQPQYIVLLGLALLLALGAAWSATGRKELVYAIGVTFALLVGGIILERVVVTHREAIQVTLQQIARDVQSNSLPNLTRHIATSAPQFKQKAEAEMPNYRFSECRVTKIHDIKVDERGKPVKAVVDFNVIASGTFKEAGMEVTSTIPRWVRLKMVREGDGRWTVEGYEHAPPQQMMFREAGNP